MLPGTSPHPQLLRLWSTFQPETHRQLVGLWTDLLQRQIPIHQGRAAEPRKLCHDRPVRQDPAAPPAAHAVVYVRQSTPRQVMNNQESTRRQYQLAEHARQMGWPAPQVEVDR